MVIGNVEEQTKISHLSQDHVVKRTRGGVLHTLSHHHAKFGGSRFYGKGNEIFPIPILIIIPISDPEV